MAQGGPSSVYGSTCSENLLVLARFPERLAALGALLHDGVPRNANGALEMAVCECGGGGGGGGGGGVNVCECMYECVRVHV